MPTTVRTSIFINAPPEAVTKVILDPDKAVLWTSDLERFEVVAGAPGQVGSIARLHYRQGERPYVMEDRLVEAQPGSRYLSRVTGDALTAEVETTLEPSGAGTRVAIRWAGSGRTVLFRLLLPFMRGTISRQATADLTKLKGVVERETESAA
jgi:carbon monoxide dehydrogenase subunit G